MLRSKIKFVNIDKSAAFKQAIEKRLRSLKRRFLSVRKSISLDLLLRERARNPNGTLKRVEAEVQVRMPGKSAQLVKKQGADIRRVATDALKAVEKLIRRESKKDVAGRRTLGKTKKKVRKLKRSR